MMPVQEPDRDKLGPTGPAKTPKPKKSYDESHPHAGTVKEQTGPPATDDPAHNQRRGDEKPTGQRG
jgi:hypothetical protein